MSHTLLLAACLVPSLLFSQDLLSSDSLLKILYDTGGWIQVESTETDQQIFTKNITGFDLPAILVKQVSSATPAALIETIEDLGNYNKFLHDAYLERSDLLLKTDRFIDGYQLIDLPFVSNRHYVIRMIKHIDPSKKNIHLDWTPLPRTSGYTTFLDSMDALYHNPIYLDKNVGGWEVTVLTEEKTELSYRILTDPAGLIPDFLVLRANRITAPQMVTDMIREAIRREKK